MPRFIQVLHKRMRIKKDPGLVVTSLRFGTIPMRLFQPEVASPSLRRGVIFFHGGGTVLGSLGKMVLGGSVKEEPHLHAKLYPPLPWEPCWSPSKESAAGGFYREP